VLEPKHRYAEKDKETILRAHRERSSLRGLKRIFGVSRPTLLRWLRDQVQALPDLKDTLRPARPGDVLEFDEVWSFVFKKERQRWLWTALCRRTRQIVAFVIGDHGIRACRRLWNKIPEAYKRCHTFSDFWQAYAAVFDTETHCCVGKETGQTAHMERWNNTLRQRIGRYIRKTLSFSKSDTYHHIVTKCFIAQYNLSVSLTT